VSTLGVLQVLGRSAGGVALHVARIASGLDGVDGLVVEVAGPSDGPVAMPVPVREVLIPNGAARGHPRAIARLRSIMATGGYALVHAHGLRAGIDCALAARSVARPPEVVVTIHNLMHSGVLGDARASVYRRAEWLAVMLSAHAFAPSEQIADHLKATIPRAADRIEVLHLGVGSPDPARPAAEVRRELGVLPGGRLVVTAARLAPQKALEVMLEAVARLPGDVVLAIAGEGPQEAELRALAADLGVADRVVFLGWTDDVAGYVAAADVFCLSSHWEAVALAAQEAVAVGTPVVSTDVGGMGELITDRESGRLVPTGDPDALAEALAEVLASEATGRRYAAAARLRLEAEFSTEAMLDRLGGFYLERLHAP